MLVLDGGDKRHVGDRRNIFEMSLPPPQSFEHLPETSEEGESKKGPKNYTSTLTVPVYILKDGAHELLNNYH